MQQFPVLRYQDTMTVEERKHYTKGSGANACGSDGYDLEAEVVLLQPAWQVHPWYRFQRKARSCGTGELGVSEGTCECGET